MKNRQKTLLSILAIAIFLLAFACDSGVKPVEEHTPAPHGKSASPHGDMKMGDAPHGDMKMGDSPHGDMKMGEMGDQKKVERTVVEPEFLKDAWTGVKLKVTDKESKKEIEVVVPLKKATPIQDTDLVVTAHHFLPSFFMDQKTISSASADPANPAVQLEVKQGDKELMNHWIFAKMPQVHGFQHEKWAITLIEGVPAEKK